MPAILKLMNALELKTPPFAPPFLKAGEMIIGHTANILMFIVRTISLRRPMRPVDCGRTSCSSR